MTALSERRLGTLEGVAESLATGPVVSVGFASYLIAASAGAATPAAIAIAFAGCIALGWVFSLFARRFAGAGTVYEYLVLAGARVPGLLAAGAYFLVGLLGASGGLVCGLLIQSVCRTALGFDPSWWTGGVAALALIGVVLYAGARLSTRVALTLSGLAAVPLLVLTVAVLVRRSGGLTLAPFDPSNGDVIRGLLYAVLLFMGFEAAACLGEESHRPHSSIPRAILLAVVISGLFYLIVLYAITLAFGPDRIAAAWGSNALAVFGLGDTWVGRPLGDLIQLGTIVDLLAFLIAAMNVAARGYFALARDGLLPAPLARTSRYGTPVGGIALILAANGVVMLIAIPFRNRYDVFSATVSAGPIITLGVYLALCALALRFVRGGGPPWRYPALLVAATVPMLGLYGSLVPFPTGARLGGLVLALVSLLGAAGWALWFARARPATVALAGRHALLGPTGDAKDPLVLRNECVPAGGGAAPSA